MPEMLLDFVRQSWQVIVEMAPYLLFGFALAGLMSIWISPEWTERHLGGKGLGPVVKATLLGIPLPLCSCSVIPVVASMRRHGASRAAATSFLLSTPQTGVDSIAVTYALLGPIFAIFRPIAALITGVLGGALVLVFGRANSAEADVPPECTDSCCSGDRTAPAWLRAVKYGFVTLPRDLAWPLLVGVAIAGAIAAAFPADSLQRHLGSGLLSILVLMAAGIPLYVCATASVPIAAGLIHLGASPGAALAFLIVGAATNPAAVTTVWKVLGRRTTVVYLVTVGLSAILCGLVFDVLSDWLVQWLPQVARFAPAACARHMTEQAGVWSNLWAVVLMAVLLGSKLPAGGKERKAAESPSPVPEPQHSCGCGCSEQPLHQLTKK
ncbi:MAG: SO_0444 family Cu/Zn efflux transporter [Thermoguttaceae bacterium]